MIINNDISSFVREEVTIVAEQDGVIFRGKNGVEVSVKRNLLNCLNKTLNITKLCRLNILFVQAGVTGKPLFIVCTCCFG